MELVIVASDVVKTGGMDRANLALATRAAARGHRVTLITHRVDAELLKTQQCRILRVPRLLGSNVLGEIFLHVRAGMEQRTHPSAIVIANGGNRRRAQVSWVHYVHAADRTPPYGHPLRRLYDRLKRYRNVHNEATTFHGARLIIADSETARRDVIALHAVEARRVVTVYYGVDADVYCPPTLGERASIETDLGVRKGRQRCLFIGGLGDRRKGFDTLLNAWKLLAANHDWEVELMVVGTGRSLEAYRDRARNLGLQELVRFFGFRADVHRLLKIADCFVAPTRYEPYGLAVHEAICVGVPAIVSKCAGVAEKYPEGLQELLLRNPEDPLELGARLRTWRSGQAHYQTAFEALGSTLRQRRWEAMADEILEIVGAEVCATERDASAS